MVLVIRDGQVRDVPDSLYQFMLSLGFAPYFNSVPATPPGVSEPDQGAVPRYDQSTDSYLPSTLNSLAIDLFQTGVFSSSLAQQLNLLQARDVSEQAWVNFGIMTPGQYDGKLQRGGQFTFGFNGSAGPALTTVTTDGALRSNAQGALYMWRDQKGEVVGATIEAKFGPGTTNFAGVNVSFSKKTGSSGSSGGATGAEGVFTNSVHTTVHGNSVQTGVFESTAGLSGLATVEYTPLLDYERGSTTVLRVAWDTVLLLDVRGGVRIIRDWRIGKYWGPVVGIEIFRPGVLGTGGVDYYPTDREPFITGHSVRMGTRARASETPSTLVGVPSGTPSSVAAPAFLPNVTRYFPFSVRDGESLALLQARLEVVAAAASGGKARVAIVRCDNAWQPRQLIADLGEQLVDTTGIKIWEPSGNPLTLAGAALSEPRTAPSAAFGGTGDLRFTVEVTPNDWTPAANQFFGGQWATALGPDAAFRTWGNTIGNLVFGWSPDGTAGSTKTATSTANLAALADMTKRFIRYTLDVDNGSGGHDVIFDTATDGVTFTQLGATYTGAGTTQVAVSQAELAVGGWLGSTGTLNGRVHSAKLERFVSGSWVTVANPVFDGLKPSFRDAQGNTWRAPTATPWVGLDAGFYAIAIKCSAAVTLRVIRYLLDEFPGVVEALGAGPFVSALEANENYAAFVDPPARWTVVPTGGAGGLINPVQLAWSPS